MHALKFIWHQFLADTRRHRWFIFGYACIVAVFTGVDAVLPFEYTSDNRAIRTWITLLPALFLVPFLVFADPVDAPEAFWRVKPVSSLSMAGAKLLWISVWLILIVSSFLLLRIFSKSESSWDSLMSGEDKSD